jgi:AraC-like DNA-binding protein
MAARANSLTERATKATDVPQYLWSMPANDVRVFIDTLSRLGYAPQSLLGSAGLRDGDLTDPDVRIPCESLAKILSYAQRERFTPNLGLELALVTPMGSNPLLDYLVVTSDTVEAGVRQLARYYRLVGNPVVLTTSAESAGDHFRVEMASGAASFSVEYVGALMVLHLRNETEGRFTVTSIHFQHTPDDPSGFGRVLGCNVRPGSSWNGLLVPLESWRLPLRRRDPILRHVLESHADQILARLPKRTGVALDVQRALASRVADGTASIGGIARQLAMSGRTLQRRLAAEGASYQQLLDDARKEATGRYIHEPSLSICEVAYLVGYSETAPFHRAFKRWYGVTPDAYRQKQRDGGSVPVTRPGGIDA